MSHLHSQPHPPHHCLGRCYSFTARVNPCLVDRDNKKILVQRQTENDCSFQFSVCLWASIFCLSLNIKTNANKCERLDSWGRMENQTEIQRGIYKRQMENQSLETNRKCLFLQVFFLSLNCNFLFVSYHEKPMGLNGLPKLHAGGLGQWWRRSLGHFFRSSEL